MNIPFGFGKNYYGPSWQLGSSLPNLLQIFEKLLRLRKEPTIPAPRPRQLGLRDLISAVSSGDLSSHHLFLFFLSGFSFSSMFPPPRPRHRNSASRRRLPWGNRQFFAEVVLCPLFHTFELFFVGRKICAVAFFGNRPSFKTVMHAGYRSGHHFFLCHVNPPSGFQNLRALGSYSWSSVVQIVKIYSAEVFSGIHHIHMSIFVGARGFFHANLFSATNAAFPGYRGSSSFFFHNSYLLLFFRNSVPSQQLVVD